MCDCKIPGPFPWGLFKNYTHDAVSHQRICALFPHALFHVSQGAARGKCCREVRRPDTWTREAKVHVKQNKVPSRSLPQCSTWNWSTEEMTMSSRIPGASQIFLGAGPRARRDKMEFLKFWYLDHWVGSHFGLLKMQISQWCSTSTKSVFLSLAIVILEAPPVLRKWDEFLRLIGYAELISVKS